MMMRSPAPSSPTRISVAAPLSAVGAGVSRDEQVRRFDVAVDDADGVESAQSRAQRRDCVAEPIGIDFAGGNAVREYTAVGQLHHEVRQSLVGLTDVVNADDVRASDTTKQPRLLYEALADRDVVCVQGVEDLQCNVCVESLVERCHDGSEATDAEQRPDFVATNPIGKPAHRAAPAGLTGGRRRCDS